MPEPNSPPQENSLPVPVNAATPQTMEEAQELAGGISRALSRAARKARAPSGILLGSSNIRARKGERIFKLALLTSFIVMFLLPLAAETVYWSAIASKQYATQMKFALRSGQSSPLDSLSGLLGGGSPQAQETNIIADYTKSRDMVELLDHKLNLRQIYTRPEIDYFSRFNAKKPIEELEKYWRKRVDVKVETLSGIVTVTVTAFTPEDSLALGKNILQISENLVNDLSNRSRQDALKQSQSELERAESRLLEASTAMRDARNTEGVIDAKAASESIDKIVTALRLEKSKLEEDLASQGLAGNNSPQARVIQLRIDSVQNQIDTYSQRIASLPNESGQVSLANRLSELSLKQIDLDLARQQYAQATVIYDNARASMKIQQSYLVVAAAPTLPEESTYPKRLWEWSIVVFSAFLIWALVTAIAFLVRDYTAK